MIFEDLPLKFLRLNSSLLPVRFHSHVLYSLYPVRELNLYFGSPDVPVKLTQMHILNLEVTFLLLAVYNIHVCWWVVFLPEEQELSDLIRVWNIRTAVTGVSHFVSITIFLVSVGNSFAVIQVIGDSWDKSGHQWMFKYFSVLI